MPKPISNINNDESVSFPSLICSLVAQGNVSPDQLYCCSDRNCTIYSSNCFAPNKLSQCRNASSLDACKRSDCEARQVCDSKGSLFCLTVQASPNLPDYTHFPEALGWMVNRSKLEESIDGAMACDNGQSFQLCNSGGNLRCGDLFSDDYRCNWTSTTNGDSLHREPLGEVCELTPPATEMVTVCGPTSTINSVIPSTISTTITATPSVTSYSNAPLVAGLGAGIGLTTFLGIGAFCWVWRLKRGQIR